MILEQNRNILSQLLDRPVLKHFLFWFFVLLFHTILPALYAGQVMKILYSNLLYLVVDSICVYFTLYFLWPRLYSRGFLGFFLLSLLAIIAADYGLNYAQKLYLLPKVGLVWSSTDPWLNLYQSASSFSLILGLALFGKIVGENFRMQQQAKERENRYYKAEIAQLRSQINPHFLFNVLNNIDEMIFEDPEKASKALHSMSGILRYSFKDSEGEKVPLAQEVGFIREYIQLMKTSYSNPDFIDFQVSGDMQQGAIAPMILIPFVENTIKHGKKQIPSPGIQIHLSCNKGVLGLQTRNAIRKGTEEAELKDGFGMQNVKRRLQLMYPERYSLEVSAEEGWYRVNLKIQTS